MWPGLNVALGSWDLSRGRVRMRPGLNGRERMGGGGGGGWGAGGGGCIHGSWFSSHTYGHNLRLRVSKLRSPYTIHHMRVPV